MDKKQAQGEVSKLAGEMAGVSTHQNSLTDSELTQALFSLRAAARVLRKASTTKKDSLLHSLSQALVSNQDSILLANGLDLENLDAKATPAFRDRLMLNTARIVAMAESLAQVANLPDPSREVVGTRVLANGLLVRRVRAPLGVLFMIFESRPNIILEAFSLSFKSGNALMLRGGSESKHTAKVIYRIIGTCLLQNGFTPLPFFALEDYDRRWVEQLLTQKKFIDVVIPRGGSQLIDFVQSRAQMPIIKNDRGLCHIYVDSEADLGMAVDIVRNAKVQRPGVCNSMETVLVHKSIAPAFLLKLHHQLSADHVRWRVDAESLAILKNVEGVVLASEEDWDTEHLDLVMNCKIVASVSEAIGHIEAHGSKHSEAIVTSSETTARAFQEEVDAAVVYWNASTRFTDGFELGLGGELGISTQKLHVRGPVGLIELTAPRWVIDGTGQIRA